MTQRADVRQRLAVRVRYSGGGPAHAGQEARVPRWRQLPEGDETLAAHGSV